MAYESEFGSMMESPPHQVLFSATALSKGKRSKRNRLQESSFEQIPKSDDSHVAALSDLSEEEELEQEVAAARCLLMIRSRSPTTSESRLDPLTSGAPEPPRRKVKKPRKFDSEDADNHSGVVRVYECKSCGKGFLSFQALGGHRATCQNKLRNASGFLEAASAGAHDGVFVAEDLKKVKTHECPVCHRVFPSGQALGGHRRTHSTPTPPATTVETACTSVSATEFRSSSSKPSSKVLLDLNMPAAEDDSGVSDDLVAQLAGQSTRSYRPWWVDDHPDSAVARDDDEADSELEPNRGFHRGAPDLSSKSSVLLVAPVI